MNTDIKICFFNSVKSWGGGEKWHYDMASKLFAERNNIYFVANKKSALVQRLEATPIPTYKVSIGNISFLNIFKLLRLYRIIKKEKTLRLPVLQLKWPVLKESFTAGEVPFQLEIPF
jgi:hypothetical protein